MFTTSGILFWYWLQVFHMVCFVQLFSYANQFLIDWNSWKVIKKLSFQKVYILWNFTPLYRLKLLLLNLEWAQANRKGVKFCISDTLTEHYWQVVSEVDHIFVCSHLYLWKDVICIPVNLIDWDNDFFPALSLGLFFDLSTAIFKHKTCIRWKVCLWRIWIPKIY